MRKTGRKQNEEAVEKRFRKYARTKNMRARNESGKECTRGNQRWVIPDVINSIPRRCSRAADMNPADYVLTRCVRLERVKWVRDGGRDPSSLVASKCDYSRRHLSRKDRCAKKRGCGSPLPPPRPTCRHDRDFTAARWLRFRKAVRWKRKIG